MLVSVIIYAYGRARSVLALYVLLLYIYLYMETILYFCLNFCTHLSPWTLLLPLRELRPEFQIMPNVPGPPRGRTSLLFSSDYFY